jgi:lipopolysaccharide biosynthesis glycosyltransferase
MENINVAVATDANYCQHAAVTLASLLHNNRRLSFRVFIAVTEPLGAAGALISATVSQFGNATVEFVDFSQDLLPNLHLSHHISLASYVRLWLTTRLPADVGRLLYLDSDVVVCSDISSLWGVDLEGNYLAAVPDLPYSHENIGFANDDRYFNAGILIIDVQKWVRENLAQQLVNYALSKGSQLTYWDQDVLNACCKNRVLFLDLKWNFQAMMAERPGCFALNPSEFKNPPCESRYHTL